MSVPNQEQMDQLEAMIDQHGLSEVVAALGVLCGDKASHLAANWQDKRTARMWEMAGRRLEHVSLFQAVINVTPGASR